MDHAVKGLSGDTVRPDGEGHKGPLEDQARNDSLGSRGVASLAGTKVKKTRGMKGWEG